MAQISLYIDDSLAARLNIAAKKSNCSVSKYVSSIIIENLTNSEEHSKNQQLKKLRGALSDPAFEIPNEIPWEVEIPRRFDML